MKKSTKVRDSPLKVGVTMGPLRPEHILESYHSQLWWAETPTHTPTASIYGLIYPHRTLFKYLFWASSSSLSCCPPTPPLVQSLPSTISHRGQWSLESAGAPVPRACINQSARTLNALCSQHWDASACRGPNGPSRPALTTRKGIPESLENTQTSPLPLLTPPLPSFALLQIRRSGPEARIIDPANWADLADWGCLRLPY